MCIEKTAPLPMYYAFWTSKHEWLIQKLIKQFDIKAILSCHCYFQCMFIKSIQITSLLDKLMEMFKFLLKVILIAFMNFPV